MLLSSLLTVVLASLARNTLAQDQFGPIKYDDIHNATTIYGTWSSGSKAVLTGPVSVAGCCTWVSGMFESEPPFLCLALGLCGSGEYDVHLPQDDRHFVFLVRCAVVTVVGWSVRLTSFFFMQFTRWVLRDFKIPV